MAVLNISEAARTWGCGRATIYRKLKSGEMSDTELPEGGRGIDTAEMVRVFGEPGGETSDEETASHFETVQVAVLQAQVALLSEQLREAKEREQWWRDQVERGNLGMIEHRSHQPAPRRGFWARLLGGMA